VSPSECQLLRDLIGDVLVVNLVDLVFQTDRGFDHDGLHQVGSEKSFASLSECSSIACKALLAGLV
jgi:hypothetical protein